MSLNIMTLGIARITTPCIMTLRIKAVSLIALRLNAMSIMTFKIMIAALRQ
jgi:hypothetical protein